MQRLFLLLAVLSSTACTRPSPDAAQRYDLWRQSADARGLASYQRTLTDAGVGDVLPMRALLRSSRRWQACDAPEFLLPPSEHAPAIVPTLHVVAELQAVGIVTGASARSGYRSPELNRCSGGSSRSRHVLNNALDFDLADDRHVAALCETSGAGKGHRWRWGWASTRRPGSTSTLPAIAPGGRTIVAEPRCACVPPISPSCIPGARARRNGPKARRPSRRPGRERWQHRRRGRHRVARTHGRCGPEDGPDAY